MNKKLLTEAEKRERSDRRFRRFMIGGIGLCVILAMTLCGVLCYISTTVEVSDQPITEGPYAGHGLYTGSVKKSSGEMVFGTIEFDNLGIYKGTFLKNAIFGVGKYTYADGTGTGWQLVFSKSMDIENEPVYVTVFGFTKNGIGISETYGAELKNGTACGNGYLEYANGDRYVGELIDGYPHGEGTRTYANGDEYKGTWEKGMKSGQGFLKWSDEEHSGTYEGEFENDLRNGEGIQKCSDGDIYEGSWKDGRQDGKGIHTYPDGSKYEGDWKNGQKDGEGTLTFASTGSSYTGHFENGELAGYGTFIYRDGTTVSGVWAVESYSLRDVETVGSLQNVSNLPGNSAYSETMDDDGSFWWGSYTGMTLNRQRHGFGTFHYRYTAAGYEGLERTIVGEFKEDLLDGYIKITQPTEEITHEWFAEAKEGEFQDCIYGVWP